MYARANHLAEKAITTAERLDLDPQDKRVRVDTYKWAAGRLDPKRWGDRMQIPDDQAELARAHAALTVDASRTALAAIVSALGLAIVPAEKPAIEGQSRDVTPR